MTDIEKKAYEKYPEIKKEDYPRKDFIRAKVRRDELRQAYIKCAEEYESLPKIHGWVAVNRYGSSPKAHFYPRKPNRQDGYWTDGRNTTNLSVPNWDGTFESEPVEVELLIRKI